jgi:hypothetical protein
MIKLYDTIQFWLKQNIGLEILYSLVNMPTIADRGCCVVSATDPNGR